MGDIQLTPQQLGAVEDRGGSLLVSAAAGSGKTKVLVERVFAYLREEHCHIDDFLIITFTRAAAAELRSKLAAELARRVAAEPENGHLRQQMFRVYQADIKTVDGFCASLLREHVHLLEPVDGRSLTPDFRILDESECTLLKERALEQALEHFYQRIEQGDGGCRLLAETLGFGRDDRGLALLVPEVHAKLQSHPYPEKWLAQAAEGWRELPQRLADSVYGRTIMDDTVRRALYWAGRLERAARDMEGCQPVFDAYADRFLEAAAQLREYEAAAQKGWDEMSRVDVTFRKLGAVRGEENGDSKAAAKAVWDKCKAAVKKLSTPYQTAESELLDDLRAIAPAMEALLELTADFDRRFQAEKVRRNAMDFSDQEHYAVRLLAGEDGTPTELGEQVSQRYREIMVDEYQDTNEVQNCIFRAVSRQGENIFAVGDVKQSIYRFRLAEPGIFLEKYRTYLDAEDAAPGQPRRRVLSRNFRSRREILDAANFVFAAIMSREMGELDYTEEQYLHFGAAYYPDAPERETEFHYLSVEDTPEQRFDRAEAEARFTARRIRQLLDGGFPVRGGDGELRPVEPEDIVILMRSPSARLAVFTAALEREGIPCDGGESEDFFSAMEIAVVLSLLEIVDNPRQDVPLIAVLRSPLVGMSADRLAEIRALQPEGDYYEALCRDEGEDAQAFLSLLRELRHASREMAADKLLWYCYDRCRVEAIFGAMADGAQRQARLTALYDYVRRLVQSGRTGLFDCVSHLRRLLENGDAPAITAARASGGVRIMSVHKSKGLEFPVVVLADLNRSFNRQDLDRPVLVHPQLGVGAERVETERRIRYDTVSKSALALTLEREAKAEELRILYVAMTRAQEKLIMVCSRKNPEKHLRELAALTELPVPPEAVSGANCPGDWLLLTLLNTFQASELHGFAGVRPSELTEAPAGVTVHLHRIGGEETEGTASPAEEDAGESPDTTPDTASLGFVYGHRAATVTPSKVTATQLKGRAIDEEIAEGTLPRRRESAPERPRFLQEKRGLTGAERGTAMHLAMQFLPLDTAAEPWAVAEVIDGLRRRRLLTPEQAAALDVPALVRFLASPLAERIRNAPQLWREYRFALLTDAGIYDGDAAGEEMLLQGVADCVFETESGLAVVDFKTDRVQTAEVQRRAEVYRAQLDAYAGALSRILERPVTERILYFFACGEEISL